MNVALALAFTAFWIPVFLFRVEDRRESMPQYAGVERFWVNATPVLLGVHGAVSCVSIASAGVTRWRAIVALALLAIASGFWFWGRAQIGPFLETRTPDAPVRDLRQDGAFAVVRHPLYFAMLAHSLGLFVAAATLPSLVSMAASAVAIVTRALQEERRLRAELGEAYDCYAKSVARLVPYLW